MFTMYMEIKHNMLLVKFLYFFSLLPLFLLSSSSLLSFCLPSLPLPPSSILFSLPPPPYFSSQSLFPFSSSLFSSPPYQAPEADYLDAAVVSVLQIHLTQPRGDILVRKEEGGRGRRGRTLFFVCLCYCVLILMSPSGVSHWSGGD